MGPPARAVAAVVAAVGVAVASGACAEGTAGGSSVVRVVTTVSPITNLVQNIAGERAEVTGLVPEGTNSHTFEPVPTDARAMAEADIVFVNGLHLEEPTLDLAEANATEGVRIVKLGERTVAPADYIYDFSFPRSEGDPNPHLWTDPLYARRYAQVIANELSELDPANAAYYRSNYRRIAGRIDALDRAVRDATVTVPPQNRKLLTYHDSFPYFARDYGWEIIGAIQPSDFSEPSPRDVAELIDQIRAEEVPALFGSEVFPSPVLEQIASETGAKYVDDLRDDDLPGDPGDPAHSYLGLMVSNFETFMSALGGDASLFDGLDVSNVASGRTVEYRE